MRNRPKRLTSSAASRIARWVATNPKKRAKRRTVAEQIAWERALKFGDAVRITFPGSKTKPIVARVIDFPGSNLIGVETLEKGHLTRSGHEWDVGRTWRGMSPMSGPRLAPVEVKDMQRLGISPGSDSEPRFPEEYYALNPFSALAKKALAYGRLSRRDPGYYKALAAEAKYRLALAPGARRRRASSRRDIFPRQRFDRDGDRVDEVPEEWQNAPRKRRSVKRKNPFDVATLVTGIVTGAGAYAATKALDAVTKKRNGRKRRKR